MARKENKDIRKEERTVIHRHRTREEYGISASQYSGMFEIILENAADGSVIMCSHL